MENILKIYTHITKEHLKDAHWLLVLVRIHFNTSRNLGLMNMNLLRISYMLSRYEKVSLFEFHWVIFMCILVPYHVLLLLQAIKPTVLIGSSGVGRTFTKEVIEALASCNDVNSLSLSLWQNFFLNFLIICP